MPHLPIQCIYTSSIHIGKYDGTVPKGFSMEGSERQVTLGPRLFPNDRLRFVYKYGVVRVFLAICMHVDTYTCNYIHVTSTNCIICIV